MGSEALGGRLYYAQGSSSDGSSRLPSVHAVHGTRVASPRSPRKTPEHCSGNETKQLLYGGLDTPPASPRRSISPSFAPNLTTRSTLSTRFRAERALLAMAQRSIGWKGPELWVVTSSAAVVVGAALRDLPSAADRALAAVKRTIGQESGSANSFSLLLMQDGCIVGPWVPSEVRHSREHVVCVTRDVLPRSTNLPAHCPPDYMAALSAYAQQRLQEEREASGGPARARVASPTRRKVMEWSPISGPRYRNDDLVREHIENAAAEEKPTTAAAVEEDRQVLAEEAAPAEAAWEKEYESDVEERGVDEETLTCSTPDRLRQALRDADEAAFANAEATAAAEVHLPLESPLQRLVDAIDDVPYLGDPSEPTDASADEVAAGAALRDQEQPVHGVVPAAQLVSEARNAWLQAKDPNRQADDHATVRGSLQRIYMRQDGTDLRDLGSATWERAGDDENAGSANASALGIEPAPNDEQPHGVRRRADGAAKTEHPAARGRWAQQPPVLAPTRQQSASSRPTVPHKRGGRMKAAEEGGPAGIVASAAHMQRLEELRMRTVQVRTAWQTSGALEALRMAATHDDSALSLSLLCAVTSQQLGAAEVGVALALAHPLLAQGTAAGALKPLAALLQAAKRHASEATPSASGGARPNAALATAALASLLRETKSVCERLDELRVTRDGSRSARSSNFDEQFAFGQALALAREAGREASRALEGEGPLATAAPSPTVASGGRRAW